MLAESTLKRELKTVNFAAGKGQSNKGQGKFGKILFVLFVFNLRKIMKATSLFPMLVTENLTQTIEFYTGVLGFECRGKYPEENPCWASLCNGEVQIAFNLPNQHLEFEKPLMTGSIYINVENIDEIWENLKEKVEIIYPIENFDYGMREFGIRDCNGYVLNLGQNIE